MEYVIVTTTCPNAQVSATIAKHLVERKLAACVQTQSIESFYIWEEKLRQEPEVLLTIKTTLQKYRKIEKVIKILHPYKTPQIIMMPIKKGSEDYLDWIKNALT